MFCLKCWFAVLAILPIYATSSLSCSFNQAPGKNGKCASVAGGPCDDQHPCIDGATCNPLYNLCFCNSDRTEQKDTGLCAVPPGGNCTCDSECDRTLSCEYGKCRCPFGTTHYPKYAAYVYDPISNAAVGKYLSVCKIVARERCEPKSYSASQCMYSECDGNNERCKCYQNTNFNPLTKTCDCIGAMYHETWSPTCLPYENAKPYGSSGIFYCNDQTFQNDVTHSCDCFGDTYRLYGVCVPYSGAVKMTVNGTRSWQCPPGTIACDTEHICKCQITITLECDTPPSCACAGASYPVGGSYCQKYTNAIGGFENESWVWSCPGGSSANANSLTCDCPHASYFATADDVSCTPYYGAINVSIDGTDIWKCPDGVVTSGTDHSCGCFGASYLEEGKDFCTPYDRAQQGWIGDFYGRVCPDEYVPNDTTHTCDCAGASFLNTIYNNCQQYVNALGRKFNNVILWTCPPGSVANTSDHTCNCLGNAYFATPWDNFCTNATSI